MLSDKHIPIQPDRVTFEPTESKLGQPTYPTESPDRLESVDWRLVYTVTNALLAALAALYSVTAPIYWVLSSAIPYRWLILLQDLPLVGMTLALTYTAIRFTRPHPWLGWLACTGAVLCASLLAKGG